MPVWEGEKLGSPTVLSILGEDSRLCVPVSAHGRDGRWSGGEGAEGAKPVDQIVCRPLV